MSKVECPVCEGQGCVPTVKRWTDCDVVDCEVCSGSGEVEQGAVEDCGFDINEIT